MLESSRKQYQTNSSSPARINFPSATDFLQPGSPSPLKPPILRSQSNPYVGLPSISTSSYTLQRNAYSHPNMEFPETPERIRPSIKDSIASLGLDRAIAPANLSLSGSNSPKKARRPLPALPGAPSPRTPTIYTPILTTPTLQTSLMSPNTPSWAASRPTSLLLSADSQTQAFSPSSMYASPSSPKPMPSLPKPIIVDGEEKNRSPSFRKFPASASRRRARRWGVPVFPPSEPPTKPQSAPVSPLTFEPIRGSTSDDSPEPSPDFPVPLPPANSPTFHARNPFRDSPPEHIKNRLRIRPDSGAPFTIRHSVSSPNLLKDSKDWGKGKKVIRAKSRRTKNQNATVVNIEGAWSHEEDIQSVIPKLRGLKASKKRW